MHVRLGKVLASVVAAVACLGGAGAATGQDDSLASLDADSGYAAAAPAGQLASNMGFAEAGASADLGARIKELESAIKKIKAKEEADKKKAAGRPTAVASGRIHFDMNSFGQNAASVQQLDGTTPVGGTDAGHLQSGAGFRRARLRIQGDAFEVMNYSAEFDFAASPGSTSVAAYKDVYVGVTHLPYAGNIRAGHFKEPFGLEQLTSSNYITFMERSSSDEGAIVPGRNLGVEIFNWAENERATWRIGCFASDPTQADTPPIWLNDFGGWALTMRATALPWYDEATEGRGLFHLGAAYSYRDNGATRNAAGVPTPVAYRFRTRPEASLAPRVIDVSLSNVVDVQLFGAEAAFVYGPFSVQSEYYQAFAERTAGSDPTFHGCYVQFGYFLTGEHRPYRRHLGAFDRVKPFENFFRIRDVDGNVRTGKGAWEIAYRYSYLDLLDNLGVSADSVGCGQISDNTIGLNWYLNPYSRVMFNYVWTDMRRVTRLGAAPGVPTLIPGGAIQTCEMRWQIDF